jgi:hypothetical protein
MLYFVHNGLLKVTLQTLEASTPLLMLDIWHDDTRYYHHVKLE